ncbi:MAG: lytic transglycosylase domain-containing protein [Aeromicrobium sp.]
MGARKLTRWQKAGALVPMALLVGAWGAALGNSGLATATGGDADVDIPDVPATAFEQPASVQQTPGGIPTGIDQKAGITGTVSTLSTNGIPAAALAAYRRSETLLGKADESCNLPWNLVAAIGRVESNHGRTDGNSLDGDGLATPGIYGIPLDGKDGRARITDTDGGKLDKNTVLDLAIGPMQFIPGTWKAVAVDSDNDDTKNPQDIDDAATAAGIYLCAGEGDLSDRADAATAVKRYNNSDAYVDLVLKISAAYAKGDFTQSPNGVTSPSTLTSSQYDQTLTPGQRDKAGKAARAAANKAAAKKAQKPAGGSGGGAPAGPAPTPGGGTGGGDGGTTPSTPTVPKTPKPPKTVGDGVQDLVDETPLAPLAPVTEPVTDLLTGVEARLQCTLTVASLPLTTYQTRFDACVYDLTH